MYFKGWASTCLFPEVYPELGSRLAPCHWSSQQIYQDDYLAHTTPCFEPTTLLRHVYEICILFPIAQVTVLVTVLVPDKTKRLHNVVLELTHQVFTAAQAGS